jgi:DNA-binding transcriptional regulator LsrR (DeoR family)
MSTAAFQRHPANATIFMQELFSMDLDPKNCEGRGRERMLAMKNREGSRIRDSDGRNEVPAQFAMDEVLWAAWLYYEQGLKQDDVAEQLGVSRASVFNLLQRAREDGVVNISIDPTRTATMDLALELCELTGFSEWFILPPLRGGPPLHEQIGRLGARVLDKRIRSDDTIGVAWGRTVLALSKYISRVSRPNITVAQITGSSAATFDFSNIAERLNARVINLHAPGVVSSAPVKEILMAEPAIRDHFALLRQSTKSIFGVTQLVGETLLVKGGFMTEAELAAYRKLGAVGFASGFFLNIHGELVTSEFDERHITMPLDQLRAVPERICMGGGPNKVDAICALLRSGLANVMIVDERTAQMVRAAFRGG